MTTINIDGDIIGIVTKPKIGFMTYTDALTPTPATVIEPTGAKTSIIGLGNTTTGFSNTSNFILSDDFEIGDIVEIYSTDLMNDGSSVQVYDTSNNVIFSTSSTTAFKVARKVFSGTGHDWFTYL